MHWQNMAPNYQFYWPYPPNQNEQTFSNQNFFIFPYAPKIQYTPLALFPQNRSQIQPNPPENRIASIPPPAPEVEPQLSEEPNIQEKERNKPNPTQLVGCQCSKSKCVKEYCFCFKNGAACHEKCHCLNCKNKKNGSYKKHENKKNKVINCNCIWSKCSKKYCECFANGKSCGESCNCLNCRN